MSPVQPVPHLVLGPDGPWDAVLADFVRHGVALAYGSMAHWESRLPDEAEQRRLLGRDWDLYRARPGRRGRNQFVVTRSLLKYLAAQAVGAEPSDLELGYALTGRLYVRGCDQVDLNLSHTGDLMLVGMTSLGVIGVDVEPLDRALYGRSTERQMCTRDELELLHATAEEDRNLRLVRQWTLKEAYTKALGLGLHFSFTEFGFQVDEDPPLLRRADGTPAGGDAWSFRSLRVGDGHVAGIALHNGGLGRTGDTRMTTTLDAGTLGAVRRALRVAADRRAVEDDSRTGPGTALNL